MSERIIYKDDDFKFTYSQFRDMAFLHARYNNLTPHSVRKGREELKQFIANKEKLGIRTVVSLTENPKFVELFGGKFYATIEDKGIKAEMYVWE